MILVRGALNMNKNSRKILLGFSIFFSVVLVGGVVALAIMLWGSGDIKLETAVLDQTTFIYATDPDSDRIGVVVTDSNGEFITLTGNQVGVLLTEFILRNKKSDGKIRALFYDT